MNRETNMWKGGFGSGKEAWPTTTGEAGDQPRGVILSLSLIIYSFVLCLNTI
jgi:hypothetical protein